MPKLSIFKKRRTFAVNNECKKVHCKLTAEKKLIMVTNRGGRGQCWWGCGDAVGFVPIEHTFTKI